MGFHYRIYDQAKPYFITMTVVDWIDVFMRKNHKIAIVESLQYCQKKKGLEIFGWCLMPSHLHMIIRAGEGYNLSDILRDFKRHTSKTVLNQIIEEPESRREWMLEAFEKAGTKSSKHYKYKFWQDGSHPVELLSEKFIRQKLDYIHNNPVEEMLVASACEYLFSSARNYADLSGMIDVIKV